MGWRLSRITTKSGDGGHTALADGSRLSKAAPRIAALGDVDELNAHIGLARATAPEHRLAPMLVYIQQQLFDLGRDLAVPQDPRFESEAVAWLDHCVHALNAALPPLREFILPGGGAFAAQLHVCRTVCRRAERSVVFLAENDNVSVVLQQYLNRLSDVLFIAARVANLEGGHPETLWEREREAPHLHEAL